MIMLIIILAALGVIGSILIVLGLARMASLGDQTSIVPDERRGWPRRIPSPGPHAERSNGRSGDGVRRDEPRPGRLDAARLVHFS